MILMDVSLIEKQSPPAFVTHRKKDVPTVSNSEDLDTKLTSMQDTLLKAPMGNGFLTNNLHLISNFLRSKHRFSFLVTSTKTSI